MAKSKTQEKTKDTVHLELENAKLMLARALADYDNLSKRIERERVELIKFAATGIINNLLPVLDMLESAQKHLADAGLAIGIGEFKKVLVDEGLTEINPKVGDVFDENTMEVIEVVNGEKDNTISEVVMTGWRFEDGQVVRHAKVIVNKQSS